MTEEENILKMVIEKENWEEVIYYIVSLENINPWDVDLVKLTESFLRFIKNIEELDFRIPAKVIFVAAILLRLKSDNLSIFEEEDTSDMLKEQKPFAELGIDPNLVQLGYPMKRVPKRQVTLDELITALRKALAVKDRKTERVIVARGQLENIGMDEEDLTKKIEDMMKEIDELTGTQGKIEFSKIVKQWKREKIVDKFIPLLHLESDKKIECEQEDYFKEIYIQRASSQDK
jgi:segregation and condensation protein A